MKRLALLTALLITLSLPMAATAAPINLMDANSTAIIDTMYPGMYAWIVDGNNHMYQQGFWYRVGEFTYGNMESPISALNFMGSTLSDTNNNTLYETLALKYQHPTGMFDMEITYTLKGGTLGSRNSNINESITIRNTSQANLNFHLFQYTDLDIYGASYDTATRLNANVLRQEDFVFNETAALPTPDRWEINFFPYTLMKLLNEYEDNLSNSAPLLGPGDLTYAYQWDKNIASGGSLLIGNDNYISVPNNYISARYNDIGGTDKYISTPEPASMLLLVSGLLGLAGTRKRKI